MTAKNSQVASSSAIATSLNQGRKTLSFVIFASLVMCKVLVCEVCRWRTRDKGTLYKYAKMLLDHGFKLSDRWEFPPG